MAALREAVHVSDTTLTCSSKCLRLIPLGSERLDPGSDPARHSHAITEVKAVFVADECQPLRSQQVSGRGSKRALQRRGACQRIVALGRIKLPAVGAHQVQERRILLLKVMKGQTWLGGESG